ncbi:RNA polymerase sigma factor [Chitinophaga nivalis]|uniref:RNA polymerase sigma-70 factor n=1 Tax=Chitinophaga nivalis TaxID=2991709 RepID=A0ABT3ITH6_9BACT|nr:RNA polymerase sigma-70 factor [Chitinophaga nivalis]MCW3463033.1 RNA polymerase sigma-70 factor [Chitinophaga nivalis]MCW3487277.1 RNA polymerase sigma-70 factor [Chitinophaga nivalis]
MSANHTYQEHALLLQLVKGDENAYRQLFISHWNQIYQVALGFLKTPEEAKDAVQTVFIKLWEKREKLATVENFDAWLFIMARNTILNILKQKATAASNYNIADVLPEDYLTPAMLLEYKQTTGLIREAIAQLPPQQSLIFRLSREQGMTHPQIAHELNIAPATVKSHMVRALNNVREYIRKQGGHTLIVCWLLIKSLS